MALHLIRCGAFSLFPYGDCFSLLQGAHMKIYTSYFAQLKQWQREGKDMEGYAAVSISLWPPRGWKGFEYKALAPEKDILADYKAGRIDEKGYTARYLAQLSEMNPSKVLEDLKNLTGKENIILLCYEKSGDFCHRHIAKRWFENT